MRHASTSAAAPAAALACGLLVLSSIYLTAGTRAQTSCDSTNTPGILPRIFAWPQNALVTVNISGQFTQGEFNCIRQVFETYNLQNAATQGNASGVFFSVTYNGSTVANLEPNGQATNTPGVTYGFQVNKQDLGDNDAGLTFSGHNGANRNSAVVYLSSRIPSNNCTAQQMNLAHDVAHTLGLYHCQGCQAGASVVNSITCAQRDQAGNRTQTG